MSRGHGELQRWILGELTAAAQRACPDDCTKEPPHSCVGAWVSASELAEARCRHLHGGEHGVVREGYDWPRRLLRAEGYTPWAGRDRPRTWSKVARCPDWLTLSNSIRRAVPRLASEGLILSERYSANDSTPNGQLIVRAA